jgi:sugar O-acyltransferase (sialic acid O-acetyltransferase NeuD family)
MTRQVHVLGAGGHAKVVIRTLQECGHDVVGVFDDDRRHHGRTVCGVPVLGPLDAALDPPGRAAVIAVGANSARKVIAERLRLEWISAVHPRAFVDRTVSIGVGTVVFANCAVQADVRLGDHVIVNTSANIDHDCRIEDFAHVAPGASLSGEVHVGAGALLGNGAVVIPGKHIGAWATVGAGGVVIADVAGGTTVVGVPARAKVARPFPVEGKDRS